MATQSRKNKTELMFEKSFDKPNDTRISKVLTTPKGDRIRAVVTSSRTLTLTQVHRRDDFDMIVTFTGDGDVDVLKIDWKKVWDVAKAIGGSALEGLSVLGDVFGGGGGGGGKQCPPPIVINAPIVQGNGNQTGPINICYQYCGNTTKPQ